MSRLSNWLVERQLNSKTPVSRLQAIRQVRALVDIECLPLIEQALTNSDVEVRREAVLALGDLRDEKILPQLLRALNDSSESVQETVIAQIKRLGSRTAVPNLVEKLLHGGEAVRWRAAAALETLGWQPRSAVEQICFYIALGKFDRLISLGEPAVKALAQVLRDAPTERRVAAAAALGQLGEPEVLPPLLRALKDAAAPVRTAAAYALARARLPEAAPPLVLALRDVDRNVRVAAAAALGTLRDPAAVDALITLLDGNDWEVRTAALEALGKIRDTRAAGSVADQMDDHDPDVRAAAADTLGRVGDDSVLEKLVLTSVDENISVRQAATRALHRVDPLWYRSERVKNLLPKLQAAQRDKDTSVQQAASGLIRLVTHDPHSLPLDNAPDAEKLKAHTRDRVLAELLRDADPACRCAAAEAIAELKLEIPVDFLALAELKQTSVEEIFFANANREPWFQRGQLPHSTTQLIAEIPRRAAQLSALITLGDFKRLELRHDHARHLVIAGMDRQVWLRAKHTHPLLTVTPAPIAADNLAGWLQRSLSVRGALVRAIRFADASIVCDLDSRAFPAAQLEQAFRLIAALF
ncbi:MAG: hypothetical protein RLZZ350_1518, partial [Verrucomicrobiota bacterium]